MNEYISRNVLSLIHDLKKEKDPTCWFKTVELYMADTEYDVLITVKLLGKKSQEQLGNEMFGVKK